MELKRLSFLRCLAAAAVSSSAGDDGLLLLLSVKAAAVGEALPLLAELWEEPVVFGVW